MCVNEVRKINGIISYDDAVNYQKLSPSTVRRYLTVLQSIFKLATKLELIANNPAKGEKLTIPRVVNPKIEIFTKAEAAEMLRCLQDEDLQFQTFIQLAIITGARRGELAALKFSDFDYDKCQLTISRAAVKLKDQPILIKPPKDYEIRTVTVNRHCIQLVQMLEAHYESEKQRLENKWVIFRIKTKQRPNSKSGKTESP